MKVDINKAKKFLILTRAERLLLLEALFALGGSRLLTVFLPFRRIANTLGQAGLKSPVSIPPLHDKMAEQIGWAVETIARHVPWESRCLAQALSAWLMLRRRGIAGTVYFGVAPNPAKPFDAHAWLRCGSRFVTGGEGHETFRVIATFATKQENI